jgi:protein-tyrosine phosphatase
MSLPGFESVKVVHSDSVVSKIYRSSQPNYTGRDTEQDYTDEQVEALRDFNIRSIINANEKPVSEKSIERLNNAGIQVHHYPVPDFNPPTKEQLTNAARDLQNARESGVSSLIYCGYGQGRTGTFVSAWEILAGVKTKDVALRETTAEVDEQKEILLELSAGELAIT